MSPDRVAIITPMRIVQTGGSQLLLADDHLVLDFPYDTQQVTEVKAIHGAKWDRVSRVWRLPLESLPAARDFANRHAFHVDPDVNRFTLPTPIATVTTGRGRLVLDGDRVLLEFRYDALVAGQARKLPSTVWDHRRKRFVAPVSAIAQIVEFATRFGLDVPDDVAALERDRTARHRLMLGMSSAVTGTVGVDGVDGLKSYQRAGVEYLLEARRAFLADDPGTGKTLMALASLEAAHQRGVTAWPAVVVCPATLVLNWPRELDRWLPGRKWKVVQGRKDPGDLSGFDMVVVGWPNLAAHADRLVGFPSYVFDESHAAKNYDAQRTKAAVRVARHAPGMVLCLTGTPITNRPAEFVPQLDILGRLGEFGDRWSFYKRYCGAYQDRFRQWHIDGASNTKELNDRLRGSCYVRRTKAQVMPELDPVVPVVRLVTPDPKVLAEYRRAEADIVEYVARRAYELAVELGEKPGSAAVRARLRAESNEHLVRLAALRRLAALSKEASVEELVEELVGSGRKVILAAHHRDVVDGLAARWGGCRIQGGMAPAEVEAAKSRFQSAPLEECPVIVLSIMAAKEGHTLTASSDVVFVEEPWTPADVDQVVARAHRLGQRDSVTAWHLLAAGTVDERVHGLIESKREVVTSAVDGGDPVRGGESVGVALLLEFAARGR
jgi:SNF2 family DNA or RNA helicase